jgi:hypothetical protein
MVMMRYSRALLQVTAEKEALTGWVPVRDFAWPDPRWHLPPTVRELHCPAGTWVGRDGSCRIVWAFTPGKRP